MKNKWFASVLALGVVLMCATSFTAEARSFFSINVGGIVAPPPPPVYVVEQYYPAPSVVYAPGPYYAPAPVVYAPHVIPGSAYMRPVAVYPRPVRAASFSFGFFR